MYTLEYLKSTGRASEHCYHKNVIDFYLLYKDNEKIFSEKIDWDDYCLLLEVDNLNKEISIKKSFLYTVKNPNSGCYCCHDLDYCSIKDDLILYIKEVKVMLEIQDYRIRIM